MTFEALLLNFVTKPIMWSLILILDYIGLYYLDGTFIFLIFQVQFKVIV